MGKDKIQKIVTRRITMSKVKISPAKLGGQIRATSFNEEDNTIEVVWSTGAKGKRYTWSGEYYEELSMKKSDVQLERLNAGAPVLNNHSSYDLRSNIGKVEKAWIKNGEGLAIVRLSKREDVAGIVQDIKDGIISNLSVGYRVHSYKDVSKKNDEIPTYRAIDWEPMEISFVNIPFDFKAQSRSSENETSFYDVNIEEREMPEENKEETLVRDKQVEDNKTEEVVQPSVNQDNERQEENVSKEVEKKIREEEKARCLEIRSACKSLKLDSSVADGFVERDISADEARKEMIKLAEKRDEETTTVTPTIEVTSAQEEKRAESMVNAIIHRVNPENELKSEDREYRGMDLVDMARATLNNQGVKTSGLTKSEIAERALHSTSDFVHILENVTNKSLRDAYAEREQTFAPFTRNVTVSDFKQISRTQLGDAPSLNKVNEQGEFTHGKTSDAAEKYSVETFGRIVGISRQTIVNDDLDALSRLPQMYGRAARDLESRLVYNEITSNPQMADGEPLFSAAHGNLASSGTAIDVASVSKGRQAMRLQKGLGDELFIDLMPKYILTPVALQTTVDQFLGQITPNTNGEVNPFTSRLQGISDPRLDVAPGAWYMIASKDQIDMIEIARLEGQQGPVLSQKIGFEKDGVQFKVVYDLGVKVIDHRGFYKNPGV